MSGRLSRLRGQQKEQYLAEAKKFFKVWRKLTIDWAKEFPDELKGKEELKNIHDPLGTSDPPT